MKIPNWLRKVNFYSKLILSIGTIGYIIYDYSKNGPVNSMFIQGQITLPRYLITTIILLLLLTLIFFILSTLKSRRNKKLIPISHPASLGMWTFEGISFEAQVSFKFNPEIQYNVSSFVDEVYISDKYVCAEDGCNADIIPSYANQVTFMICSRDIFHFEMNEGNEFFRLKQQAEGIIRGEIRNDFEKFKNIYITELDKATKGKYHNFDLSWNKHKVISRIKNWRE